MLLLYAKNGLLLLTRGTGKGTGLIAALPAA
uniref:Uncharacterized protein n=1 Tax=uncultured marine bacterium 581 TaxID=257401 RepID=Q6SFE7_9BACT|nr:hypothetical protein MBMO_EBAC000-69B03.20 [uncultured marine bacterium 581]